MKEPINIILRAEELAKRFRAGWVFRGVSFRGRRGESLAITGPNGSGKSTLCEILAGIRRESSGLLSLSVNGNELSTAGRRLLMGFTSPRLALYGDLSAAETVGFVCGSRAVRSTHAFALCERLGLSRHMQKPVRHYSSGMRQRLKIALALAHDPAIFILDEPGTNLDEAGKDALAGIVDEMRPRALIIIATNEEREAVLCAGRVRLG